MNLLKKYKYTKNNMEHQVLLFESSILPFGK